MASRMAEITRHDRIIEIKKAFDKTEKEGIKINHEMIIAHCCELWAISRRTAMEYINIAASAMGYTLDSNGEFTKGEKMDAQTKLGF